MFSWLHNSILNDPMSWNIGLTMVRRSTRTHGGVQCGTAYNPCCQRTVKNNHGAHFGTRKPQRVYFCVPSLLGNNRPSHALSTWPPLLCSTLPHIIIYQLGRLCCMLCRLLPVDMATCYMLCRQLLDLSELTEIWIWFQRISGAANCMRKLELTYFCLVKIFSEGKKFQTQAAAIHRLIFHVTFMFFFFCFL